MKEISRILILLALIAIVSAGCGGKEGQEEQQAMDIPSHETGEAGVPDPGAMAFKVNDQVVTEADVAKEQSMIMQQMGGSVSPAQMQGMQSALRQQAVTNILNRTLLRQAAVREGIEVTEDQKTARIDDIKGNFESEEQFESQMTRSGLSMDNFEKEVVNTIMLETLIDRQTAHLEETSQEQARDFYDQNSERFVNPERVRASHVLVKLEPEDDDSSKAEKRRKIEGLLAEIKGGGDFATIAKENSDCPSSANGGDLGFFARGQMVKPFEDAAFALEAGEISGVVETRFGYHVIKLTEREESSKTPFESVSGDIITYLDNMRRQKEVEDYLQALRETSNIVYADSSDAVQ